MPADRGFSLDEMDLISRIGYIESGLDSGYTAAYYQSFRRNADVEFFEWLEKRNFCHSRFDQRNRFARSLFSIFVDPGALLADIRDIEAEFVHPYGCRDFHKRQFMQRRRTAGDHNAVEAFLPDFVFDEILTGVGAHIGIIGRDRNAGLAPNYFGNTLDIDSPRDINPTMTNKYTEFFHSIRVF